MKSHFDIRPKHWYEWINPRWWKRRKITLALLNHEWEKRHMDEVAIRYEEMLIRHGEGSIDIDLSHF